MKQSGKLVRWNEERGFGFIQCPDIKNDIFIHISELKKMSRRPITGDTISFDVASDKNGKTKAVHATIEGVAPSQQFRPRKKTQKSSGTFRRLTTLLFLIIAITIGHATFPVWSKLFINTLPVGLVNEDFTGFTCRGKQYCNEMTSCKEARFYLKNCPNVKIDGDHDGIPCESQWCH